MDATNIEKLITMPKKVLKVPPKDFKQDNQHLRKDFTLQSTEGDLQFSAFIRRHIDFQENFSIGLDFHPAGEKEIARGIFALTLQIKMRADGSPELCEDFATTSSIY